MFGAIFWLGLVAAFAAPVSPLPPPTESPALESLPPALVIVVWDTGDGPTRAALTFARQVDHKSLEQSIADLGRAPGWKIWNIKVKDEEFGADKQVQTSATFNGQGLVDRQTGKLGLEPLLAAFGGEVPFRVAFVVPGMTNFSGPAAFRTDRLEISLFTGEGIYEYEALPVPGAVLPPTLPTEKQATLHSIGIIFLVLLLASVLLVVVVWLWYGMKSKALTDKRGDRGNGH
jgi:hypothetical protein